MQAEDVRLYGRRLRALRVESDRDVAHVARLMGVSPQSWYAYEAGRNVFAYTRIPDVARALDVPLPLLLERLYREDVRPAMRRAG